MKAEQQTQTIGVGEKLEALEPFHAERMAQRIIGQGDMMGLIEKVEAAQLKDRKSTRLNSSH